MLENLFITLALVGALCGIFAVAGFIADYSEVLRHRRFWSDHDDSCGGSMK